jgi:chromosome segregation ATPase
MEDTLPGVSEALDMRGRYEQALAEVEEMKRTLREHAQRVAAREKELDQLRLEVAGRQGRRRQAESESAPGPPAGPDRSDELAKKIAEAEKRERQAVQELALAKAERERLDEREQAIRKVERELAGLRMHLLEERARLTGSAASEPPAAPARDPEPGGEPPPPTPLPQPPSDPDLEPAAEAKRRRSSMLADPQLKKPR